MSKKQTVGTDPYAEFGGEVISDDPYAEFGGEVVQEGEPATPPMLAAPGKPSAPPATGSPSTSVAGSGPASSSAAGPIPKTEDFLPASMRTGDPVTTNIIKTEAARGPLFNSYEEARTRMKELREQEKSILEARTSMAGMGGMQAKFDKQLSAIGEQIKSVSAEEKKLFSKVESEARTIAEASIAGDKFKSFVQEVEGRQKPNAAAIHDEASRIAKKYGAQDTDAYRRIYDKIKSGVEAKIIEPAATKKFEAYLEPIMKGVKAEEAAKIGIDAGGEQAEVTAASAKIASLRDETEARAKSETESVIAQSKQQFGAVQQKYDQALQQYKAAEAALEQGMTSGAIPKEQAKEQFAQARQQYEAAFGEYQQGFDATNAASLSRINEISSRYNRQFEEQQLRIVGEVNSKLEAYSKALEQRIADPEVRSKIRSEYKRAWMEAMQEGEQTDENVDKFMFNVMSSVGGPTAAATQWFARSTVTSLGGSIKGMATTMNSDLMYMLGDEMENAYITPQARSKELADLADLRNVSKLSGQLLGGMAPSLVASAGVAYGTGGAGAPVSMQLIASSLAGWATETVDIAGRAKDQVFSATGDMTKAEEAFGKSIRSQVQLMPTYAFEGLPFVGKVLGGIGSKAGRVAAGAGIEYGTEMFQEIPQGIAENNIVNGRNPWDNFGEGLMSDQTIETMIGMAPIALLGAAGQVNSKSNREQLRDQVMSYIAKNDVAQYVADASSQWVASMVTNRGEDFSTAVLTSMYSSGRIDADQYEQLLSTARKTSDRADSAKGYGLNDKEADVYTKLSAKADDLLAAAEKEQNPQMKAALEARAKEINSQLVSFFKRDGKPFSEANYVTVTYPDGTSTLMDMYQATRLFRDPAFASKVALLGMSGDSKTMVGSFKVESGGAEGSALVDQFMLRVENAAGYAASVMMDPASAQFTASENAEQGTSIALGDAESAMLNRSDATAGVAPASTVTKKDIRSSMTAAAQGTRADLPVPTFEDAQEMTGKVVEYEGNEGFIDIDEGGKVTFTTMDGETIVEMGTQEAVSPSLATVSVVPLKNVVNPDGTVSLYDQKYVGDIKAGTKTNKDGDVVSVTLQTEDGQERTFRGETAQIIAYENLLRTIDEDPVALEKLTFNITTNADVQQLIQSEQERQKRRITEAKRKRARGKTPRTPSPVKQDEGAEARDAQGYTAAERAELSGLIEQEQLDSVEKDMAALVKANPKYFKKGPSGEDIVKGNAPGALQRQWNDLRDTLGYKNLVAMEPKVKPAQKDESDGSVTATEDVGDVRGPEAPGVVDTSADIPTRPAPKDKGEAPVLQDEAGPQGDGVTAPYVVPAAKEYGEFHVTYDPETKQATATHQGKIKDTWSRIKDNKKAKKEFNRASRALTQAKLAAVNKFIADTGVEVVKGKNAAQQKKSEKVDRKIREGAIFKNFSQFDDETKGAYGMALSLFAGGGKVSGASVRKYLGWGAGKNTGDAVKSKADQKKDKTEEENRASWALSDSAPTIASLAHNLYENAPKDENGDPVSGFDTADFEEAIAAVVSGFNSQDKALDALEDLAKTLEDSVADPDKMLAEYQAAQLRALQEAGIDTENVSDEDIQSAITEAEDEDTDSDLYFGPPKTTTDEDSEGSTGAGPQGRQESSGDPEGAAEGEGGEIQGAEDLTADDIFGWEESEDPMFQIDQRRKALENELAAARKAVTSAAKDINERGQSLFGDALDANGQTIVGDAFDNSQENYDRIMAPLKARVEKAKADLEAYDKNKAASDAAQGSLFQREGNKGGRANATRVAKALSKIAPGIKIESFTSREGYAAAIKARGEQEQFASSVAVYFPATNEILLSPAADGQSLMHEAAHPILIAALKNNPDLLANFYEEILKDPALQKYVTFGEGYADQGPLTVAAETIVEFMADVAAGNIKVSMDPKSAWQKFKAWVKDLLDKLGITLGDIDMSKPADVRKFAAAFSKAVNKGIPMMGLPTVGGAGAPSLQQDVDDIVDGWYSRLNRTVADKGNTQSGESWMKWAEARAKEGALSMEEVKWTGLADFLQGKEKVTKEQVRDFLKENRVKVEVKVLSGEKKWDDIRAVRFGSLTEQQRMMVAGHEMATDDQWAFVDNQGEPYSIPTGDADLSEQEALEALDIDLQDSGSEGFSQAKFSQYQLPGGTNYREVLVTLPVKDKKTAREALGGDPEVLSGVDAADAAGIHIDDLPKGAHVLAYAKGGAYITMLADGTYHVQVQFDELRTGDIVEAEEFLLSKAGADIGAGKGSFHSSHFEEPNILVHLRLNDRTGPNGEKILFIEELQSDWGQKGKKEGFDNPVPQNLPTQQDYKDFNDELDRRGYMRMGAQLTTEKMNEFYALNPDLLERKRWLDQSPMLGDPIRTPAPSAPFVTSTDAWVELGLKQAIRMAVEGGYDRIAWTTGEQQNERYDLSKQFSTIAYNKQSNGKYEVIAVDLAGRQVYHETVEESKLEDIVGKDVAQRMVNGDGDKAKSGHKELSGDGLKIGGSGMKGFYDKILPTVAKKVAKKLGGDGSVVETDLTDKVYARPLGKNEMVGVQRSIAITDAMRSTVRGGTPLMQRPPGSMIPKQQYNAAIRAVGASFAIDKDLNKAINAGLKALRDKTPGSWWTSLSPEDQKKAEGEFKGIIKGKIASKINPTKATVNVMSALKDQIRLRARAARDAVKDMRAQQKEFAAQVSEMIKDDLWGRLSPVQANSLIKQAAATDPSNPKHVARFYSHAKRVINNANYAEALGAAKEVRTKAKRLSKGKGIPANLLFVLRAMAAIDPRMLSNPLQFALRGNDFLNTFKSPTTNKYNMGSSDAMAEYLQDLEAEVEAAEAATAADEAAFEAADLQNNYMAMFSAMMSEDPDQAIADLLEKMEQEKQDELKSYMVAKAETAKAELLAMDTSDLSSAELSDYKDLIGADMTLLNIKQLAEYVFGVDNMVVNESMNGLGKLSVMAGQIRAMVELGKSTAGTELRTDWPTGKMATAKKYFKKMFYGLPNAAGRIFGFVNLLGEAMNAIGFNDVAKGKASADASVRLEDKRFTQFLKATEKKAKENGRSVHNESNRFAEGVVSYLIQEEPGYSPEASFDMRKAKMEQDISRNAKYYPHEYELVTSIYESLVKDAKSANDLLARFKQQMPENHAIVEYLIEMNKRYRDEIFSHNSRYRNQIDSPFDRYLTTTYKASEEADARQRKQIDPNSFGGVDFAKFRKGLSQPKQAGKMKARHAHFNLRPGSRIDYNIRRNTMEALSSSLYEARTTKGWLKVFTALNSEVSAPVLGGQRNVNFLSDHASDVYKAHTSNTVLDEGISRPADWISQRTRAFATFFALAGFDQFLKQTADQGTNALLQSLMKDGSKSYVSAAADVASMLVAESVVSELGGAKAIASKDTGLRMLISLGSIGERGETLSGTRWSLELKSAQSNLRRAVELGNLAKVEEAYEALGRIWFASLRAGDVLNATTQWVSYYNQYLKDKGVEKLDYVKEAKLVVDGDKVRNDAFAFAENMTHITQGPSDPAMFGAHARRSQHGGWNLVKTVFQSFGGFQAGFLARVMGSASEIRSQMFTPASDEMAAERMDAAVRTITSAAVSQAAFLYMRVQIATTLYAGGAAAFRALAEMLSDDDEDDDILAAMSFIAEVLFTLRVIDKTVNSMVQTANRDEAKETAIRPLGDLYDPEAEKNRNAAVAFKVAYTQWLMAMTVSGTSSVVDDLFIDRVNWGYWKMMSVFGDSEVKRKDGTIIPYETWKKDPSNTPLAKYGQWKDGPGYGMVDIVHGRYDRLTTAAAGMGGVSPEEAMKSTQTYKRNVQRENMKTFGTTVWSFRDADSKEQKIEAQKAFGEWLTKQPQEKRKGLNEAWRKAITMPASDPDMLILASESNADTRAMMFYSAYSTLDSEEERNEFFAKAMGNRNINSGSFARRLQTLLAEDAKEEK